jgi:hypothetical protein
MFILSALALVLASRLFQIAAVLLVIAAVLALWLIVLPRRRGRDGHRVSLAEEVRNLEEDVLHPPHDGVEDTRRVRAREQP